MTDNIYYVYLHRRKDSGEVFYIGKGKNKRHLSSRDRNKDWKRIVNEYGFYSEIIKENLTNEDASTLEFSLIAKDILYPNLVNKRRCNMYFKSITHDMVKGYVIDDASPSGLSRLRKGKLKHIGTIYYRYKTKEPSGWYTRHRSGKVLAVHRIIMVLKGIPLSCDQVVNHINSNPLDNSFDNLEVCSITENNQRNRVTNNIRMNPKNTSGITGVLEVKNNNKGYIYYYAMACWSVNNTSKTRKFSYNKYGKDQAWALAIQFRNEMVNKHYKGNN